jgi:hypothetical protein
MSTTFLRFPDRAAFELTLPLGFMLTEPGETGAPLPAGVEAISIVGEIAEGEPPAPIAGWHVNTLGATPEAWLPYVITPATPVRVFGDAA